MKTVSVIIPIYNAEKFLKDLFFCLDNCHFIDGDEILLIDNGSTDNTKILCDEKATDSALYHVLCYTDKACSYATRNYALKYAKGDILIFTDSDCKPTSEWLEEIRNNINLGEVFAGQIELEIIENNLWEHFDSISHLGKTEEHIRHGYVPTANMAVHREDFNKVGVFEERFSGGDFEWSTRAKNKGLTIKYHPRALVYHPSRKTYEEILVKEKRIAYGAGKSQKNKKGTLFGVIVKYFLKIFKIDTNIKLTRALRKRNISVKNCIYFNIKFFEIRWAQLVAVVQGYTQVNARQLGIK